MGEQENKIFENKGGIGGLFVNLQGESGRLMSWPAVLEFLITD